MSHRMIQRLTAAAILMYDFLKLLKIKATHFPISNNTLVFSFSRLQNLQQSICVLKWNMTDRYVLRAITQLHLAKWVNLSFFPSQNRQNVFQTVLCSFNMNWVMFQSNKSQLVPNRAAPNRAVSNGLKKSVFDYPCRPGLTKIHLRGSAVEFQYGHPPAIDPVFKWALCF